MHKGIWLRQLTHKPAISPEAALELDGLTKQQYFTPEERKILLSMSEGIAPKAIREIHNISQRTLWQHQRNIFGKYAYAALCYRAEEYGFLPDFPVDKEEESSVESKN